jgi:transcriptional regulator with XRE-family HTH domain
MYSIVCIVIVCRWFVCKRRSCFAMQRIEALFGEAVRKRRSELGISQEDFADKAGIHRTYVSSIELGKVQISIVIAHKLAVALEMPLSKLWQRVERSAAKQ